jgi:hypothetical protein
MQRVKLFTNLLLKYTPLARNILAAIENTRNLNIPAKR